MGCLCGVVGIVGGVRQIVDDVIVLAGHGVVQKRQRIVEFVIGNKGRPR